MFECEEGAEGWRGGSVGLGYVPADDLHVDFSEGMG